MSALSASGGHAPPARRMLVVLTAVAYTIAVVLVIADTPAGTSYHAESVAATAADLAAGLALLVVGAAALWAGARSHAGVLATLAGAAWFAADWEAWSTGPALARAVGMLAAPLTVALLLHLVLAFPRARLDGAARALVAATYAITLGVCVGRALFRDPLLDAECWRNCTDNAFLVHANSALAGVLDVLEAGLALAAGAAIAAVAAWRVAVAGETARRVALPVLVPAALVGVSVLAYAALLLLGSPEDPADLPFAAAFLARGGALLALALGLGWSVARAVRLRSAVAGLAAELGAAPPPGSLRAALARAVGDPNLLIAYRRSGNGRYVDAQGRAIEPPAAGAGRARTPVLRRGDEVAVVVHDAMSLEPAQLQREIGAAARMAVANERLGAERLAQLRELRESQARIVESADRERQRLERDLHDGAQQRLLTLSYRLRLARAAAESAGRSDLAASLGEATDRALEALAALRELAHGIFPAVLAESGLAPALWTLAGGAPLPVEIAELDENRAPPGVEIAAYLTVQHAVQESARRGASHVGIRVVQDDGNLTVEIRDDAPGRAAWSMVVADRVGALGGRVELTPSLIRVEIPCV